MSKQNATKFFQAAVTDTALREKFKRCGNLEEFLQAASELGYTFTQAQLMAVVKQHSEGINFRRKTGVWLWLRSINWIEEPIQNETPSQKCLTQVMATQALAEDTSNKKQSKLLFGEHLTSQNKQNENYQTKQDIVV